MRHKNGIDMVHVIANQRRNHTLVEPAVDESYCAALADKNRIGLATSSTVTEGGANRSQ